MTINPPPSKPDNNLDKVDKSVKTKPAPSSGWMGTLFICLLFFAALGVAIFYGIASRTQAAAALKDTAEETSTPFVEVIHPKIGAPGQEIKLPGSTQPFTDTPIYSRTSGYLKKWYFDIGSRVKQGQLLAEIETPEVDQQLEQAQADMKNAQANLDIAQITAKRYQDLLKSNSVSQQEADQSNSDLTSRQALVTSSQANIHRLQDLQSFEKIYAPFDGVVTARDTDIGALIQAGGAGSKELFHLSDISNLRVFIAVPELYAGQVKVGESVPITLDSLPDEKFHGTLSRTSNTIDAQSRTLNVEVDVDNSNGHIFPGAYVFVHLPIAGSGAVTIPTNTLLFRSEGLRVGVVKDNHVVLTPITIGHDYGNSVEVVTGLTAADAVITDPSDSLIDGSAVQVQESKSPAK